MYYVDESESFCRFLYTSWYGWGYINVGNITASWSFTWLFDFGFVLFFLLLFLCFDSKLRWTILLIDGLW